MQILRAINKSITVSQIPFQTQISWKSLNDACHANEKLDSIISKKKNVKLTLFINYNKIIFTVHFNNVLIICLKETIFEKFQERIMQFKYG